VQGPEFKPQYHSKINKNQEDVILSVHICKMAMEAPASCELHVESTCKHLDSVPGLRSFSININYFYSSLSHLT
jgi:hypothetical protein